MNYEEFCYKFKCQHCGDCCNNFSATIDDKRYINAILRVCGFPISTEPSKIKIVIENSPCNFYNPLSKMCMDYLGRPDLCRRYFCEKSKITPPSDTGDTSTDVKGVLS